MTTEAPRIAVIAPSGPVDLRKLAKGKKRLGALLGGATFIDAPGLEERFGYLAGDDDVRVGMTEWAFARSGATHVWFARGGFGTTRIVDRLPWRKFAASGRTLLGYSDATAFLLAYARAGGRAIHAPMIATDIANGGSARSDESLTRLFSGRDDVFRYRARWLGGGSHLSGRVLAGNLAVLAALAGTPHLPVAPRRVICLEEVNEEPYRVDRLLTQLHAAGFFRRATGVVFGSMTGCVAEDPRKSITIEEVMKRFALQVKLPTVSGFPFGHGGINTCLPIDGRIELDGRSARISSAFRGRA